MKLDSFERIFSEKQCVMAIMPHPDDLELYSGGLIARLIEHGVEVVAVKMTNGGKGTKQSEIKEKDLATLRSSEDIRAASILGIKPENNFQLDIPDGELQNDLATIEKVANIIRKYRPDLIITCNPEHVIINFSDGINWVNHRDHRATAQVATDAAFPYSRDTAFFPHQLVAQLKEYKPTTEFLFADYYSPSDTISIDISNHVELKRKAWNCHRSVYTPEEIDEVIELLNKENETACYYETFRYVIAD